MSARIQIWLVFLLPVVLVGGLLAFGLTLPVPYLGRAYVITIALPEPDGAARARLPEVRGPMDRSRPLVVIDAGHGGRDPGASGNGRAEKAVVLALARALRDRLLADGGVRVAMTREDDRLIALSERPEIARRLDADLFISIHADSAGGDGEAMEEAAAPDARDGPAAEADPAAARASGASIYTLSARASSEAAARFAARENDADRLNGVIVADQPGGVSDILVELAQRRVQERSDEFARLVVREGAGRLVFHPQPRRSAALAVLRAPDVPAILYEAGFITDRQDAERLTSQEGRARFADTMARAIRIFFARRQTP